MKKLIALLLIASFSIIACNKKVIPDTGSTGSTPSKTEVTKTEKSETATTNPSSKSEAEIKADVEAKAKAEATDKQPTTTPSGPMTEMDSGKGLYTTKCASCHAMKNTGDYTYSQWQNILKSMVPKARLNSEQEKQLTAYIKANCKQ